MTQDESSSGVQELIDRLHDEGLSKGQQEADQLLEKARRDAREVLDQAKQEGDELVASAIQEAERTRKAGEEAVRLAGRDTILQLTEELREDFVRKLRSLVTHTLEDTEFLRKLILEVARKSLPEDSQGALTIDLLVDDQTADAAKDEGDDHPLNQFVRSLSGAALRDGLTFEVVGSDVPGVRVQAVDDDLEVELSTETITHLLIHHLSPRFRAIVEQE